MSVETPTHPHMDKSLSPASALQLVSSFFEDEWPKTRVEDVEVRRVTGGNSSFLQLVSRKSLAVQEPAAVLVRHYSTPSLPDPNRMTEAEETLIFAEMGSRGWAPKLYGIFPGGRVEEFIDAHILRPEESMQPDIRHDLGRSYARVHSLRLPFRRNKIDCVIEDMVKTLNEIAASKEERVEQLRGVGTADAIELSDIVFATDWGQELLWIQRMFVEHKCKRTMILLDTNFSNVLVKEFESECKVMLIDYEGAKYGFRGIDIGGHFTGRIFQWNDTENRLTGLDYPDLKERQSFCQSYLKGMEEEGQELGPEDTIDHLMLEADVGQLFFALWVTFMLVKYLHAFVSRPHIMSAFKHCVLLYHERKQLFLSEQRDR